MKRPIPETRLIGHRLTLGAMATLMLMCTAAHAADAAGPPVSTARYRIEQSAQPMSEFLRGIAARTNTSVLFDPAAVGDRVAPAVRGQLTAAEAIAQAIAGSGLEAIVMSDGSIVVRPVAPPGGAPGKRSPRANSEWGETTSDDAARFDASRADLAGDATGSAAARSTPDDARALIGQGTGTNDGVTALTRVEVTGSRLKRIDADGPAPVNVYSRAEIERSGQPTLERFISSLNEASVSAGEGAMGITQGQGAVQLRGLPLGSTLLLINGRRLQAVGSSAGNYFNLNLIPMAAVERVEVVPVGSSAVYGGDALAGVVNIILKKSIDGVALDAHLGSGKGTSDGGFSLGTGGRNADGSFLVLGAYAKTTPLTMAERGFFLDADYRRFGGPDARTRSCTPGTVSSTTGGNLPGLNAAVAGIPASAPGQLLTVGDFRASAGQPNLCNTLANGHGAALVYGTESVSLHAAGEHRLGSEWTGFGELTVAKDRLRIAQSGLLMSNVLVPAANPFNPFGVAVRVSGRLGLENGAEGITRDTDFKRLLIGARGELLAGWDAEVSASTTRDDGDRVQAHGTVNAAARTSALAATNPALALNPFTAGRAASDDVLRSIWSDALRDNHGRKDQLSAFVRGSPVTLSTGTVDTIVGLESVRDRYRTVSAGQYDIRGARSSRAVYGEARVPLWRDSGELQPSREAAALTLAARRDHYSDFGGAGTYQAGLEVRPTRSALLRGSVATSFKPPTLLQTNISDDIYSTESFGVVDPANNNAPIIGGEILRTGNPALQPEKGRAYTLGTVFEPEGSPGDRLAITAWRVKIRGLISLLDPQSLLNNEALFPGLVTRGPASGAAPGPVTRVLYTEVNFGGVDTAGLDMELTRAWRSGGTRWTASASATRTLKYDVAISPGAAIENRLARRDMDFWSPRWKGRIAASVDRGGWSLGVTARYLGSYGDLVPDGRRLGNTWTYDLAASLDLQRAGLRVPGATSSLLSLSIANLTDRLPQFANTVPYYDVTQGDWRGRYATVRLSMNW